MFNAKIIADSISKKGHRLTTFEVTFPRLILAEVNTHRIISKNSASSRAIPVEKMIKRVLENPFIPKYWGKNQKGMSADVEVDEEIQRLAEEDWLIARDCAVKQCKNLLLNGIHKQITNRLLEPFMWHTALLSATTYENMFNLRAHKDAQPEFQTIASMMKEKYLKNEPLLLKEGEWHLALVNTNEHEEIKTRFAHDELALPKVSAGRSCRVSYLTHDGKRDLQADYDLAEKLQHDFHMSPMEHQAKNTEDDNWYGNFQGWKQYRKFIPGENICKLIK